MPTNHGIEEWDSPFQKSKESEVHVGDTIEVHSNNQLGYKKYLVVKDEDGEKGLRLIVSLEDDFNDEFNHNQSSRNSSHNSINSNKKRKLSSSRSSSNKKHKKTSKGGRKQNNRRKTHKK